MKTLFNFSKEKDKQIQDLQICVSEYENKLESLLNSHQTEIDLLKKQICIKEAQRDECMRLMQKYRDLYKSSENIIIDLKKDLESQKNEHDNQIAKIKKTNINLSNQNTRINSKLRKLRQ